ncbi:glycosyltransferase [Mariniphaga sediminis]|uniref:Glycosyltransferase n=1 Tax=Mariniphaga sediminis TaxID=1628158 RepID=A0A399D3W5_9BACT|nr:glycosyltransferase [Mariniphaga sediminis]
MLKTVKIIGTAFPFRGGLAAYNERLAREYSKEGYDVTIETFTLQYPQILFPGKTQYAEGEPPKNLKIRRTINSINPISWLKTGERIKREKPDLVIFKYWLPFMAPCFGTIAARIKKNKHSRIVCIADNIIPHEKRFADNLLTKYFLKKIDGVVAQSKSVFNDVFKFTDKLPVKLCPHPLFDNFGEAIEREKALKMLELDPQPKYVLFFGFIRDYKGLDLLLKAFADPRIMQLNVKLIVAGEFYTDSEPYMELIDKLHLKEKVILKTNFISDKDVGMYFCASDIVAQPYKNATQSGVTQIGYHFNKPMLVTNVGGLPEIIPHQVVGYVTEPNENDIADSLFDFFSNDKKSTFETNIQDEKKKFLWSAMTNAISEVLDKIEEK